MWALSTDITRLADGDLPYPRHMDISTTTDAEQSKASHLWYPAINTTRALTQDEIYDTENPSCVLNGNTVEVTYPIINLTEIAQQEQNKEETDNNVKADALLSFLLTASPAQIDNKVDTEITDLTKAKTAFKILFKLAAYTLRRLPK